jgi:hypothetical protein
MWPFKTTEKTNDPQRLKRFIAEMDKMRWDTNPLPALEQLFKELNTLVYDDVLYYIRVRNKHRRMSAVTRLLALILGSAGLLTPLVVSANPALNSYAGWGYPLLAAAGAVLLANRLFGSTKGHIRYATAQLALEHLIVQFNLRWLAWRASIAGKSIVETDRHGVFSLFNEFIDAAYKIVQEETTVWGTALMQDLESVSKQLTGSGGSGTSGTATETSSAPKPGNATTPPRNGARG